MTKTYILTQLVTAYEGLDPTVISYYGPDGTTIDMKKEAFDKIALEIPPGIDGTLDTSKISLDMVNGFISGFASDKLGEKTAVVVATCRNGFEIVDTASPVDAKNYNHDLGVDLAKKRIVDKAFAFLGFLLQTARNGVNFR